MRKAFIALTLLLTVSAFGQEPTARDYYNQLVKANGVEGFTNSYVCFRDEPNDQFLTFSKTEDIAKLFPWEKFAKDSTPQKAREAKAQFEKPALMMLGYKKGVQVGEPYFLDKDGEAWMMPMKENMRIRFTINWKTLRYRWAIETKTKVNPYWTIAADHFGQCEDRTIPPAIE